MFINYWRDSTCESGIPLLVARVLFAIYTIWKLLSYKWSRIQDWPHFVFTHSSEAFLVPSPIVTDIMLFEVIVTLFLLIAFGIGYRIRFAAFTASLLLAHLSGVHHAITNQSITFLPVIYFLIIFALFSDHDVLSIDEFRRTRNQKLSDLNTRLQSDRESRYPVPQLRWGLLVISLTYFFTGYGKLLDSGLGWMSPNNLGRMIQIEVLFHLDYPPVGGMLLVSNDFAAAIASIGTVILEVGFVFAILFDRLFTPFIIGLLGMHTGIAIWMHVFFFDQYLIFLLFLPWGRLYRRIVPEHELTILYDEHCHFCARSLWVIKQLDINRTLTFVSQSEAPASLINQPGISPEDAMYVFTDEDVYEGYYAFRRIFGHFRLIPLTLLMGFKPVEFIGTRLYQWIADNRSRYFVCAVDEE